MPDEQDFKGKRQPDGDEKDDPRTREVIEALQRAGRRPQPPAGFVNKLNKELEEVHRMNNESLWFQFKRWLPAAAGASVLLVALVAALFIIPQYLRPTTELEPRTDAEATVGVESNGVETIAGAETIVDEDSEAAASEPDIAESEGRPQAGGGAAVSGLPVAPGAADSSYYPYPGGSLERPTYELAVGLEGARSLVTDYELAPLPLPESAAGALTWAEDFGLADAEAYRSPEEFDPTITVIGGSGERLVFHFGTGFSEVYYNNPNAARVSSEAGLTPDEALAIAEAWWLARGFGPDRYRVSLDPWSLAYPDPNGGYMLQIKPLVDGRVIEGWNVGGDMSLNGNGEILHARIPGFALAPAGELNIISQQEAYEAVVNGGRSINYFYEPAITTTIPPEQPQFFTPQADQYDVGETVTLRGWPTILEGVTGDSYYVEFYDYSGIAFLVTGPQVAEFAASWQYEDIAITGVVVDISEGNLAVLELLSWAETTNVDEPYIECFMGMIKADGSFHSERGETLQVAGVPAGLAPDTQIDICGEISDDNVISWIHISTLPHGEFMPHPEESYLGPVYHTEYGYDQNEFYGDVVEEEYYPQDPFGPDIPLTIGDEVDLTGELSGAIFESSTGELRYELYLYGSVDDTPTGPFWGFRVYGEEDLLRSLAAHHGEFIRVEGTIIAGEPTPYGPGEVGVQVNSFESFPGSAIRGYFGQVAFQEIEGRSIMVFIDEATGAAIAIDPQVASEPEYYPEFNNEKFDRVWLALSVHPYWEFAGMAVGQIKDMRIGREIEGMIAPDELLGPWLVDIQIQPDYREFEGENYFPFTGHFVIERVALSYTVEPGFANPYLGDELNLAGTKATPIWIFYGTDPDSGASLTIQVAATPTE